MIRSQTIKKLRQERAALIILARKKRRAETKKEKARKEELMLKKEINQLKNETSKNVFRLARKELKGQLSKSQSPEAKRKREEFKKKTKKGLKWIQDFANKYG